MTTTPPARRRRIWRAAERVLVGVVIALALRIVERKLMRHLDTR